MSPSVWLGKLGLPSQSSTPPTGLVMSSNPYIIKTRRGSVHDSFTMGMYQAAPPRGEILATLVTLSGGGERVGHTFHVPSDYSSVSKLTGV